MNILLLHNRYQFAGGEDVVVAAEAELLKSHGHRVHILEADNSNIVGVWGKTKAAVSAIYSPRSKDLVMDAIQRHTIDLVHVHNFFPLLSPSVYDACSARKIPVVQTLHNYRLGCPKAMPFRNGEVCDACFSMFAPIPAVVHSCYRDSYTQSAVVAAMLTLHRWRKTWTERVDAYIALTQFQRDKLIQTGLPPEKIYVKPNFTDAPESHPELADHTEQGYALFVGRLSEEKGVATLLNAYAQHKLTMPLKIVGDGTLRPALEQQVKAAGLSHLISFSGRQGKQAVMQLMQNAQFLVFPSIWYEGFPLTIVEAFASGLPVLSTRLGSMSEIIEPGITGLHFEAGNADDLADKIRWAATNPEMLAAMGRNAKRTYQALYTPETNYHQLMAIYRKALNEKLAPAYPMSSATQARERANLLR